MRHSQQRIAELEAELRAVKEVIEDLSDHGSAAERMDVLKTQRAEIDRLSKLYRASLELLTEQGALLTRAADALAPLNEIYPQQKRLDLIAELRKATQ